MAYVKYTREVLSQAVAASSSMAAVLRHLGLRQNGGAHAHLRRRIDQLGIDTTHFLGRAHARGAPSTRRKTADQVLVMRSEQAKRAVPAVLTRALLEIGRPYLCAACGLGDTWNARPITLHVDHIDGRFWDCRAENLRFLCPNCHSQTETYAGRNRPRRRVVVVRVDERGNAMAQETAAPLSEQAAAPLSEQERAEVLARVERRELTVSDAARLIGCHRNHVYQLRRRLAERGSLTPAERLPRTPAHDREEIIAFAVAHPALGARRLSEQLRRRPHDPIIISHGTVATILTKAGLNTRQARLAALQARAPSTLLNTIAPRDN